MKNIPNDRTGNTNTNKSKKKETNIKQIRKKKIE